ncbi:hypothetical protein A2U01_0043921 [Trifolium medium]|uniref:Uncharacterized protein n=1 Tax=Trifolium medium TaxID=97028 RepID=A0A392QHH2_9FABA|nr:hypothetical protein [Trifolium medium]
MVRLSRSARPGEGWRTMAESFHPPGENQRAASLLVAKARSATTQEHTRSLEVATRLAQRQCLS